MAKYTSNWTIKKKKIKKKNKQKKHHKKQTTTIIIIIIIAIMNGVCTTQNPSTKMRHTKFFEILRYKRIT